MTRMIACVMVASVTAEAVAAPVPKTSPVDAVLARVTVEHVGSALSQPALRKELALTAEQEKKLTELTAEYEKKLKKASGPDVIMGPFDFTKQVDLFKEIATVSREYDAAVVKLLSEGQHRRLRQVQLQKGGPVGLLHRHVVRALALSAEQEDAMALELAKYRFVPVVTEELIGMASMAAEAEAKLGNAGGAAAELKTIAAFMEKESAEQEKVRQAMLKHLTAEQRATWAALIGPPVSGPELLRAGSIFGDVRVMNATMKSHVSEGVPPPANAPLPVAPPPPPPGR